MKHFTCLQTVSILLNRAQDIEDILREYEENFIPVDKLLERIRLVNNKSLDVAAAYLPG